MIPEHEITQPTHFVVVEDPTGRNKVGDLIKKDRAQVLFAQRGTALPVVPKLFQAPGAGYVQRFWGEGIPLYHQFPKLYSPLALYGITSFHSVNWALKLQQIPNEPVTGYVQLSTDNGEFLHRNGNCSGESVRLNESHFDQTGEVTIVGKSLVRFTNDGPMGLGVYGQATGCRLLWLALTQTP